MGMINKRDLCVYNIFIFHSKKKILDLFLLQKEKKEKEKPYHAIVIAKHIFDTDQSKIES